MLTTRQTDIIDVDKCQVPITIVGAGTIGSNLAILLARLGITDITVIDFDTVEDHNLGHQAYRLEDIDRPKVEALRDIIKAMVGTEIKIINDKIDGKGLKTNVLCLGVDNMASRKEIAQNAEFDFVVDGRVGGETFNVYTYPFFDLEGYIGTIYSDEEASELPCGGRAIGYMSYMVSAMMELQIKKILVGEDAKKEINYCAKNLILHHS